MAYQSPVLLAHILPILLLVPLPILSDLDHPYGYTYQACQGQQSFNVMFGKITLNLARA